MFRRSRFSVRPNVSTAGRTSTSQEAPSSNQEATETPTDTSTSSNPTAVIDTTPAVMPSVTSTASGDGSDHILEGGSSSAAVQRRKRFSVKPKVAPGRPSTIGRTLKSPIKSVSETPVDVPSSDLDKPTPSSQTGTTVAPQGLQSTKQQSPSEESRQPKVQPKITLTPSDSSGPSRTEGTGSLPEELPEKTNLPTDSSKSVSQVQDSSPKSQDKVPPSLPDKETVEISEKAKTLVSSKSGASLTPSASSLSRLLNDPSDLQRLAKAQKLRELLRQERYKEKKHRKSKARVKKYTLDPSKMTMSDLIHYLPLSNPMTSSLEDMGQENETVVPPSPGREESPESAQEPEVPPKVASLRGEEVGEEEEEEDVAEEDQEEALMVPQVKVAEDGSLIIDEESLTVEVLRAKGPNPAQDRDPIFERGSTTTYSSFRTLIHSKPWSNEETDMFFLAVSMVGTDFTMISQLFPHRARSEIKNKFKKEERQNSWRIDKAFRERRKLDIEYFSKLLEKILEFQKNKKKLKSLAKKNTPKKSKKKAKGKKGKSKLSDAEEEEEDDANEVPDLDNEEGGEKENEDLCNEGESSVSKPKKQRKRKSKQEVSNEEQKERKKKRGEKSSDQAVACIPEDTEAALPEDHTSSDILEKTQNANPPKDTTIKPAQLSRGRASKPLVQLGRKWGKKPLLHTTKAKDTTSDNGDDNVCDEASKEQVNKELSPLREANKKQSDDCDVSSEEEHAGVQPPRPTRYGRIPKPIQPLNYPTKEDAHSSASDATPASPVGSTASATKLKSKCTAKRVRSSKQQSAQVSKKPKLVTLRASQSEYSDDEDEKHQDHEVIEEEEEEQFAGSLTEDGSAPVFVPASLRSPPPVISQVEETMEELDILANIPDVLGISQDALCPGVSWEQAQNETGTPEPCEHQLDLLVDVIDFLSSEHQEVCEDESYNEAAHTLLAIGNPTHLPQTAQNQLATQDHITGTLSVSAKQTGQHLEEAAFQEASNGTPLMFGHGNTETSETLGTVEQQHAIPDIPMIKTSDQTYDAPKTVSETDPSLQVETESLKKKYPQTRKGHVSKVKPKPNLGRSSKMAQPKSQPDKITEQTAKLSNLEAANYQVTETLFTTKETILGIPQFSPTSLIDDISCTKVKLAEKLSSCQEVSSAATLDQSISENQSRCFSDAQFEPSEKQVNRDTQSTSESSSEKLASPAQTIASSNNLVIPDISVTETQIVQGSNTDSVPLKELSEHTVTVSEIPSTSHCRGSRLKKVKPKPNVTRTSRTARLISLTKDKKDSVENDSTPILHFQENQVPHFSSESEEKCGTCPEKPSHSDGPAAALISLFDSESTLSPTTELSTTEDDKSTNDKLVSLSLSDLPFKPSSRDTGSTSATIDEKRSTQDKPAERSDGLVTPLSAETVSQAEQESREHPGQSRRNRLQKVKPKPNIPLTPRTARSTPQPIDYNPTPILKAVVPSSDSVCSLSNTEELPTIEKEEKKDDWHIAQVFSVASTSGQSVSRNQIYGDTESSATTDQKWPTQNEVTENSDFPVTSDSAVKESQVGQDLAAVTESGEDPATHATPVEDLPISQKEVSEVTSVSQSRSSKLQKVKPNMFQTSTTAQLTPQTKDKELSVEDDSNPTPLLKLQEKAIVEIEPEEDCGISPEKSSHMVGPATALISSVDPESTLSSTKKPLTTENDKSTIDGLVGQLYFAATSSGQSCSENQSSSNVPFKPSSKDTGSSSANVNEKTLTQHKPVERNDDLVTSQDSREHPATYVTSIEDLPVHQKAEGEGKTSGQSRRSRLQKVKPKPNIPQTPRTPRSSHQTTKDCVEKDHNPSSVLKALVPSCDSASMISTTQELRTIEEEIRIDEGCVSQVFSVASRSDQSVSENQIFSGFSFEPQNRDTESASATTDQKWLTQNEMTDKSDFLVTFESAATESQTGQHIAIVTESSEDPATHVTPVEDLTVGQKEVSKITSVFQSTSQLQKVKPKPNTPQRSRTALLTPQSKDKEISIEDDSNPTPLLKIHENAIVEIEQEGKCGTCPEKPSHTVGPAMALIPSSDPECTLSPRREPLKTEEDERTDDGLVRQLYFAATSSGQNGSESPGLSDVPFKPSGRDKESSSARDEKVSTQDKPAERSVDLVTSVSAVVGTKGQVFSVSSSSEQCVSENQVFSDVSFETNDEDTGSTSATMDKKWPTRNEITESSDISVISNSAATESQARQDFTAVTESSDNPATHVTPVEDLPVSQKEQNEAASVCQPRRFRSQKVKPKPNIPQRSRTTKDSNPTPISKLHEKTKVHIEHIEVNMTPPENLSQIADSSSVLITSSDFGSSLATTKKMSTNEKEKMTDDVLVGQSNTVGATSGQFGSENRSLSAPYEPSSKDIGPVSAVADDTAESSGHPVTSDPAPTESQIEQHVVPLNKSSDDHLSCFTPVSQKQAGEVASIYQPRQVLKLKPKPNLSQSSRTFQSKPQIMPAQFEGRPSSPASKSGSTDNTAAEVEALPIYSATHPAKPWQSTNTSSVSVSSVQMCTTEELSVTVKQKTELALHLSSDSSEPEVPQKRRPFPKVKPNLGSSTRPIQTKPQPKSISFSNVTLEKQPVDNSQTKLNPVDNDVHLTSFHCPIKTELSSTQSALDESEKRLDSTHDKSISTDIISIATSRHTENQSMLIDSVIENKSREISTHERQSTGDEMSNNDMKDVGPASQEDWKLDVSTKLTESNTHPQDNSTAASGDAHTISRTNLHLGSNVTSIPDTKSDTDLRSEDETAQSTNTTHSDLFNSSKSSKNNLQTQRGRLIKPKPNLGCSSQPLQPQVQDTTQKEADSGSQTEDGDSSVSHDPGLKLQPDIPEPVEAIETHSKQECPSNDTASLLGCFTKIIDQPSPDVSPLGCLTQVLDSSSKNTSILTTEGDTKSHPCLALFPHMTSEQVPSDPDEPFFILSLTEIPVGSSEELVDTAVEPHPFVGETSVQQQSSVSGEILAPVEEGPLYNDSVSTSAEDISEVGFICVKDVVLDPADNTDLIIENPVDPLDYTSVHPLKLKETVEDHTKTEIPPTNAGRRAKLQVQPNTMRKTQASNTFAENANKDSELPGSFMQPEGSAGSDLLTQPQKRSNEPENTEQETQTDGKSPENGRSGARTQTAKAATRMRKSNSNTPSSDPPSGKSISKGSKVKTPQTKRKHFKLTPVASLSFHDTPTANLSQQPKEIHSKSTTSATLEVDTQQNDDHSQLCSDAIPSTSQSAAEVSASQQSPESFTIEEEPTTVSQYFISDIFTEVDED